MIGQLSVSTRKNSLLRRTLPVILAVSTALSPLTFCFAAGHGKHKQGVPGIKSIVLFPAANNAGTDGEAVTDELDTAIRLRLNGGGIYQATTYSPLLPSIQRALTIDNTLTDDDVKEPITDPTPAQKIARVMDTDGYLLDEVDAFKQDDTSHAVTVTVSGSLYYTNTGGAARTFAVTGTGIPTSASEGVASITQRAVDNAASQVVDSLGVTPGVKETEIPNTTMRRAVPYGSILLVALAAVLVGVILHNTGSHGSSPSMGSPSTTTGTTGGDTTGGTTSSSSTSTTGGPPAPPV